MVDEDFILGYVIGYNDSTVSGGGLDDYPVFQNKKFRVGNSDFYLMVGDINSGFYDRVSRFDEYTRRNSEGKIILRKYDPDCVMHEAALYLIAEKNGKRFLAVNIASISRRYKSKSYNAATDTDGVSSTTYYLDTVSFSKSSSHYSSGYYSWSYFVNYDYHYVSEYPSGDPYVGYSSNYALAIQNIEIDDDGSTIRGLPSGFQRSGCEIVCNDEDSYMELLDLLMTLPDITEED